jgi:hypothetical protein
VEIGLLVLLRLGIEDGQDLLPRIVGGHDRVGDPASGVVVPRG